MKKKLPFIIESIIGIAFVCFGYFIIRTGYYSTLFYSIGFKICYVNIVAHANCYVLCGLFFWIGYNG